MVTVSTGDKMDIQRIPATAQRKLLDKIRSDEIGK
jgi:hypothetical protein